ncbi:hypothetical protein DFS33DRAFT_1270961 [Desarmillaria ectypa]|nr:hypothetical protein DFS33DRAFT_1270961 [Desarmillaria ectypa]
MSKFAILSALVVLSAHLSGGLASPAMMKRQEQGIPRPVGAAPTQNVEARQLVPGIISGVTSLIGGILADESASASVPAATASAVAEDLEARQLVPGIISGVTSLIGGILADESASISAPAATATAEASSQELEARQAVVISVGGGVAGASFGGVFTVQSSVLPAASKAIEADIAAVTSVVRGVTSVVGGAVGGVTSIVGGAVGGVTGKAVPTPPVQQ